MVECYRQGGEVGLSISERGGELRLGVHDTATKVERRKLKRMDGTTASSLWLPGILICVFSQRNLLTLDKLFHILKLQQNCFLDCFYIIDFPLQITRRTEPMWTKVYYKQKGYTVTGSAYVPIRTHPDQA